MLLILMFPSSRRDRHAADEIVMQPKVPLPRLLTKLLHVGALIFPHSRPPNHPLSKQVATEDEKRAAADRDLMVKKATYKTEINQAQAAAEVAFDIEKAKQGQMVRIVDSNR